MSSHRLIKISVLFFLFTLLSSGNMFAGIIITDEDGSKTYISNGKMKELNEEDGMIMNGHTGEFVYFNPGKQVYTRGKISEFCEAMSQLMEQMMASMPPEYKEMLGVGKEMPAPEIEIISEGDGGSIAGYKTERYTVNADGQLYETVWITTDSKLTKEFQSLVDMFSEFVKCNKSMNFGSPPVEASDDYVDLMKKGLTLKSVQYEDGEEDNITSTLSIETLDIPDSEFQIPAGFTEVSIIDFFTLDMEDTEEY